MKTCRPADKKVDNKHQKTAAGVVRRLRSKKRNLNWRKNRNNWSYATAFWQSQSGFHLITDLSTTAGPSWKIHSFSFLMSFLLKRWNVSNMYDDYSRLRSAQCQTFTAAQTFSWGQPLSSSWMPWGGLWRCGLCSDRSGNILLSRQRLC